ncbi:hypothetical protein PORY_002693 [Pneumocystis oryctolagi]|uniref:Uncharacterized protein n=1 Tax=Pneumocystis oryctolagi TaxID=42067 RepID=A0ACB7CG30_9ASCO|nr:hypothetical protein PORY_002693 [Pneumocystis oryctolagi]
MNEKTAKNQVLTNEQTNRYLNSRARLISLETALETLREKYSFYASIYHLLQQITKHSDQTHVSTRLEETKTLEKKSPKQ